MKRIVPALLVVLLLACPAAALANAAAPPSVLIVVPHAPRELSLSFYLGSEAFHLQESTRGWERYYALYHMGMPFESDLTVRADTAAESREYMIPLTTLQHYNNTFTLLYANGRLPEALSQGQPPGRDALLVGLRLALTLLLEGLLLFALGYRQKRTWVVFLCMNLLTQGLLNLWLLGISPFSGYAMITLYIGEFFVFLAEGIAFPKLVKEKTAGRRVAFTLLANLASLVLGGLCITLLPV